MGKTICGDPGHGYGGNFAFHDPGAIGPTGVRECDVTLAIWLNLKPKLEYSGLNVILTRESDVALGDSENADLQARCNIANNAGANLFISIHCNSAADESGHGTETYCYKFGGEGEKLANAIQKRLNSEIALTNRGVKEGNFAVLRNTNMSAVLVETAFISNPAEEKILADSNWQEKFADAIGAGICDYLGISYQKEESTVSVPTERERVENLVNELVSNKVVSDKDYWVSVLMNEETANYMYLRTAFSNALDRIKGI